MESIKNNSLDKEQVLKDLKSISDGLPDSEEKLGLQESLNKCGTQIKGRKTNLIFLGNKNSGKTASLNSTFNMMVNRSKTKLVDIFPTSDSENTYFITIVEASENGSLYTELHMNGKLGKTTKHNTYKDLQDYLFDLNEEGSNFLDIIQEKELKETEKNVEIQEIILIVRTPDFLPKFLEYRLIDTPGLVSEVFRDRFKNFLINDNSLHLFMYVTDLMQGCKIELGFQKIFQELFKIGNSFMFILLTKIDELEKTISKYNLNTQTGKANLNKRQDFLNSFFKKIEKDYLNANSTNFVSEICFIDNEGVSKGNEKCEKRFLELLEKIDLVKTDYGKALHEAQLKRNLFELIRIYDDKISTEYIFDEKEKEEFRERIKDTKQEFVTELYCFCNTFPQTFENFQIEYSQVFEEMKNSFAKCDKEELNEKTYYKRQNYIEEQCKLNNPKFQMLVCSKVNEIQIKHYNKFFSNLSPKIQKKLKDLSITLGFELDNFSGVDFIFIFALTGGVGLGICAFLAGAAVRAGAAAALEASFVESIVIGGSFGSSLGFSLSAGSIGTSLTGASTTLGSSLSLSAIDGSLLLSGSSGASSAAAGAGGLACIPVWGWIAAAAVLTTAGIVYHFKDSLGCWKKDGTYDDIIHILFNSLIKHKEECIKKVQSGFFDALDKLYERIEKYKEEVEPRLRETIRKFKPIEITVNKEKLPDLIDKNIELVSDYPHVENVVKEIRASLK
jgi:hypothetical protein